MSQLTRHNLRLDDPQPVVWLETSGVKNRRDDGAIPLLPEFADRLRKWMAGRGDLVFDLWTPSGRGLRCTSKMLEVDCTAAGVAYHRDLGIADFHSLRWKFVTDLCRSCDDVSTVVKLARHSDPRWTISTHDQVRLADKAKAINGLRIP